MKELLIDDRQDIVGRQLFAVIIPHRIFDLEAAIKLIVLIEAIIRSMPDVIENGYIKRSN